jgi:tetratricopeptide (TPR) repeat protein
MSGDFALALEALGHLQSIGETSLDPFLQSHAHWTSGWVYAMQGKWEAAIEACTRSLEGAPVPLQKTLAMAHLGYTYLDKGDASQAIALLGQAVQQCEQFRFRIQHSLFAAWLSEAYFFSGDREKARELGLQGLAMARDIDFPYSTGLAQRVLGRIAQAGGAFAEAETYLKEALQTFASIQARFEVARTHLDLAQLAHRRGDGGDGLMHLRDAHHLFRTSQVPNHVQRAEALARDFGVLLAQGTAC